MRSKNHYWARYKGQIRLAMMLNIGLLCATMSASAQHSDFSKPDFINYSKDGFSVSVPDYLVPVTDLNPSASLQLKNVFNETYFMLVPEIKSKSGHESLEDLQADFEMNLMLKGGWVIGGQSIKIDGHQAYQSTVCWKMEDHELQYLITFIDTPEKIYKIYAWTLTSQKELLAPFKTTADSFRLSPAATSRVSGTEP